MGPGVSDETLTLLFPEKGRQILPPFFNGELQAWHAAPWSVLFRYILWSSYDQAVQIRDRPCKGNGQPNGKGVRLEVEFEGNRRQPA